MHLVIKTADKERRAELTGLAQALREAGSVPGPVEVVDPGMQPGRLGPVPEAITIGVAAVGAGGSITIAVRELIRALLRRRSDLDVSVSLEHGRQITVIARDLQRMSADELATFVDRTASTLREMAGTDDAVPEGEGPETQAQKCEEGPG